MYDLAFEPVFHDLEKARAIFSGLRAPPLPEFQAMAAELHRRPGKWMRPGLFLLAARAGGSVGPKQHAVAAAIEMVHSASLLHDDVLDEASLRRHADSANVRWGNRAAILFGDFLLASAFRLVAESGDPKAYTAIARAIQSLCHGEAMQDSLGREPRGITPDIALAVAERKTASFIAVSCRCGHLLGGGGEDAAAALGEFGRRFGVAYQITDDLVDLVGDENAEGKSLGSDLRNGRPTLPLALLIRDAGEQALILLPPRDREAVAELTGLMRRRGAIAEAAREAARQLDLGADELLKAEKASSALLHDLRPNFQSTLDAVRQKLAALPI
jgi:octaprenyl-diphosphate synthase